MINRYLLFISVLFLSACRSNNGAVGEPFEPSYDKCKETLADAPSQLEGQSEWFKDVIIATCKQLILDVEFEEAIKESTKVQVMLNKV